MNFFLTIIAIISAFNHYAVKSDALWEGTWVNKTKNSWWPISQIYRNPTEQEIWISSYDTNTKRCTKRRVLKASKSRINCHVTLGFTHNPRSNDILCAPTQEFYLPETGDWVPAYKLKIGDKLLSDCHVLKTIRNIDLLNKPLNVNSIEIEEEHNFLVGRDSILTHNSAIEASLQLFMEFGEGAATGAAAGSFFGPIGWAGGILLGGAFGIALCSSTNAGDRHDPHYDFREYNQVFKEGAAAAGGGDPEDPDPQKQKRIYYPEEPDDERSEFAKQTKQQLLKSKKSFEKLIKEHKEKLENYKKNPEGFDNKGLLKNSKSAQHKEQIMISRMKKVESQIKSQTDSLEKINRILRNKYG